MSSPTIWGRFASWLTRSLVAVCPKLGTQTYVDDPLITFDSRDPEHRLQLGAALLWFAVTGFPIKLSKADSGSTVTWIGASIQTDDELQATRVTIPEEKIKGLLHTCKRFLAKPVVGRKELRSFAGALSFVAGVVSHLRPFLASVVAQANDRGKTPGKLVHTRRIGQALKWISAFLGGENSLTRVVMAKRRSSGYARVTPS